MRILRVEYAGRMFFASLRGRELSCMDTSLGLDQPLPIDHVRALPPVTPTKIVGVNLNARELARELGMAPPSEPEIFYKPPSALCGPGDSILLPPGVGRVLVEGQLAVVLGKHARNVSPEEAPSHVFGFCLAADVTAVDMAGAGAGVSRAKSFDTFLPLGPWIETEVPDPMELVVTAQLNGQVVGHGAMADMAFTPYELVSVLSRGMTLLPGDTILCGASRARALVEPGDEVRVEAAGVGLLINPVMTEPQNLQ